ncbi:hypothetical protein B5M42_014320 [Paenibacillus athensensis]|uniref:Uncharacterized protein n=1 Tax=Paenibacillus athensensis TaxID=1967502 RepID=A0A4Y8Q8F9_9BACL|nr:hypothetical protein [Paenibacillus athensensis]MCD1259989.1 hypothetical protein [Paenibacillus athensensis]
MMKKTLLATCGLLIAASACIVAQAASPSPSPSAPPSGAPAATAAPAAGQAKPPQAAPGPDGGRRPAGQQGQGGCSNQDGAQKPAPGQAGQPGPSGQPPQGGPQSGGGQPPAQVTNDPSGYTITITDGYNTDPIDHGRPVVLIASALGVPTEVFREAFSGVTPAGAGSSPTDEQARSNKAALLKVLAPYGITNDRLDEVSNYYRYAGSKGEMWKYTAASVKAIVKDGALTGVEIVNAGAGYSSTPTVTITGPNGTVTATATVKYTQDFATNGSISAITLK